MENNTCTSAYTCTAASSDTGTSSTAKSEPKPKAPRLIEDSINTDGYCACFGLYTDGIGTGREWLECACGRWIHEECIEDVVYNANGKEKLCPLCLAVHSIANSVLISCGSKMYYKFVYSPFVNGCMQTMDVVVVLCNQGLIDS